MLDAKPYYIYMYLYNYNVHVHRDLNLILLKRVRDQLKMSDFPPNCMRFVVYGGVWTINGRVQTIYGGSFVNFV